jgi:uncharacterized protein (DUF2141 family)
MIPRMQFVAGLFAVVVGSAGMARAQCCDHNVLRAQLVDLPNNKGRVGCIIFNQADGFPRDRSKAVAQARGPIRNGVGTCEFRGLPPGTYAIAAFHDEFETGKMKTNFLGVPQEAYGFSGDAKPSALTPPPFNAAAFSYPGGAMDITMHAQH